MKKVKPRIEEEEMIPEVEPIAEPAPRLAKADYYEKLFRGGK